MKIVEIELGKLIAHPANANVMSEPLVKRLRKHIEQTGMYEPLVVRRHPRQAGCYELLNGHHRKGVLEQLKHERAQCVVWDVSDAQALMLLATLNRLSGRDDAHRRAELLGQLAEGCDHKRLLESLPETRKQLQKLLALREVPEPVTPDELEVMPVAMTFFVTAEQKAIVEQGLKVARESIGGDCPMGSGQGDCDDSMGNFVAHATRQPGHRGKLTRGDLLACMGQLVINAEGKMQSAK